MGGMEGIDQWERQKGNPTESFHMDSKVDPVEKLVEERGLADALFELSERLKESPEDPEVRRQVALILNRAEDIAQRAAELKRMTQH